MGKSGCYSGWCKNDDRGMWLLWKYAGNIWEKKWMKQLLKLPLHCSTKYFNVKSECCKPSTKIWHMKNQKEKKTLSRIIWCNFLVDWCCLYIKSEGFFLFSFLLHSISHTSALPRWLVMMPISLFFMCVAVHWCTDGFSSHPHCAGSEAVPE